VQVMTPHRTIFARILSKWVAQLPTDGLILDIGCGMGTWIEVSSRYAGGLVGLDVDKQVCSIASAQVRHKCEGIVLYAGGAFPFKEESFQGAYAHEVIEHVSDDAEFIAEAYRVLKNGGSVILTTPNGEREPLDSHKHSAHVRHYSADQLSYHLQQQGFEIEELYWRMHPLCGVLDDALSQIGNRLLRTQGVQPGLTHWSAGSQSGLNRFLLMVFRLVEPLIRSAVIVEFEVFKTVREARNMIFIARKGTQTRENQARKAPVDDVVSVLTTSASRSREHG
jgi:SAM-dependent methyltransferase